MTPNRLAAFILIAFAIGYGYLTTQQPKAQALGDPGLTLFPWVLNAILVLIAISILVQDIKGTALPRRFNLKITPGGIRSGTGLGLVLVYFFVIPYLGFLVSSALFFASMMWLCGERRPLRIVGYSCAIPIFLLLFFQELFQIPLPKLGFLQGVF
jgi:putative tricarboxylic transport membrane protein